MDHRDAFLDTEDLERERGITIFSKQAVFPLTDRGAGTNWEVTLLDTPGHVDFAAEMERALQVLDCAVLVVSGSDGVQAHTLTLWRLLEKRRLPVFLFVNKMDLAGTGREALLAQLKARLGDGFADFGARSRSRSSVSRKASRWSTRPRERMVPVRYRTASDRVVFPASTWARMPMTSFLMDVLRLRL